MDEQSSPSGIPDAGALAAIKAAAWARRVVFWLVTQEGRCELVSDNWTALSGQAPGAALGTGWLDRIAAEDRPMLVEALHQALRERRGFTLRYRVCQVDGRPRWILHQASPRMLPSGRFDGLIGTLIDTEYNPAGRLETAATTQRIFEFLDGIKLAAVSIGFDGRIVHGNPPLFRLLGETELIGADWIERFVAAADRDRIAALIDGRTAAAEVPADIEFHIVAPGGERLLRWHLTLIRDFLGEPHLVSMLGTDITQWRAAGNQSRLAGQMFENSVEAMLITDADNNIIAVNPAFTQLTGFSSHEILGRNPRVLQSGLHGPEFYAQMWRELDTRGHWQGDIWGRHKDGRFYPKFLTITAIRDEAGKVSHYSAIFYDASDRKAIEEQLDFLAHFDSLTELPNRMLLLDRLEQALAGAARYREKVALLFIDLDEFKPINDTHGHGAGDEVLREVARRLARTIRAVDTAARLGGDEFVVVLPAIANAENALHVAQKLSAALAEPYVLSDHFSACLSASIGISLSDGHDRTAGEMLRTADDAMYLAKRHGKSRIFVYGPPEESGSAKT